MKNIHYFSYDYDKNIYGSYDVSTTETWAFKNTTDGGNYAGYNISITITAASGKLIDKTKNEYKKDIIFIMAWNEWGEGNMMEPDMTYGRGFIDALRNAIDEVYK